ncbi:hypothetical protein ACFLTM_01850 [Candidatus Bipolaricaulota bacterium]
MKIGTRLPALALLVLLVLPPWMAGAETSSPWVWGPILGIAGEDLIALSWETSRPVSVDLHYGLAQVHESSGSWGETLTFDRQEGRAEIWLRDLAPDTEYRYQIIAYEGDAVYPSKVGSFRTAAAAVRSFTFAVYGNTRSFPDRHKLVADTIARDESGAAFAAHVGELVETLAPDRIANFLWAIADLARSVPYATVVGSKATNEASYYEMFALPQGGGTDGEEWWSFDYGTVHVIGLNSMLTDPSDPRAQEQLAWLRQDLSANDGKLAIVFSSDALYGSAYPAGRNEPLIALWEPALRAHEVAIVFSASTGGYEHVYTGGIHHVTTGGGGGPLADPPTGTAPGLIFSRYGILHYVRITVADAALRAEAVPVASVIEDEIFLTPSGRAIDSFVVRLTEE